jgi:alkylation response protein AidB-like acyl-CoA dehydrogenase
MRFAFTEDQVAFADAVRGLLRDQCTPDRVRAVWDGDEPYVRDVWEKLAGMGVVGLTAPASAGGLGMGPLDWVLLFEEAGRVALPAPLVETTAVAIPLLASLGESACVERAASGDGIVAITMADNVDRVAYGASADAVIVCTDDTVRLLGAGDFRVREVVPSVEHAWLLAALDTDAAAGQVVAEGPEAADAIADAYDRGALAAAAELCGLGEHLLAAAVEYATHRKQFGVAIGTYQAIKHHLADVRIALSYARPLVHAAAWHVAEHTPERSTYVSMAKAYASDAAVLASKKALQVHGAIGYTWEYDLQLWMKKAWALAVAWGDADFHRRRVADAVLG